MMAPQELERYWDYHFEAVHVVRGGKETALCGAPIPRTCPLVVSNTELTELRTCRTCEQLAEAGSQP